MKTSEMIAMLEKNSKLRFKRSMYKQGIIYGVNIAGGIGAIDGTLGVISITDDWELVREPVPVWEAVKALYEGKKITCHKKGCGNGCAFDGEENRTEEMDYDCIATGTWYIEAADE